MFRFTIRDVLWLTLAAGLTLGWWCWCRSRPPEPVEGFIRGTVLVSGKPMSSGRAFLHSPDGQFRGTQVSKGSFAIQGIPYGKYTLTFEGDNAPQNKFPTELSEKCQAMGMTYAIGPPATAPLTAALPAAPTTETPASR